SKRGVKVGTDERLSGLMESKRTDGELGNEGRLVLSTPRKGLPPMLLTAATLANRGELARWRPNSSLLAQLAVGRVRKQFRKGTCFPFYYRLLREFRNRSGLFRRFSQRSLL